MQQASIDENGKDVNAYISASDLMMIYDITNNNKEASQMIILYSCHTGERDNSFGLQLSAMTDGIVIAPSGSLFVRNLDNTCFVEDPIFPIEQGITVPFMTPPIWYPQGSWNVFEDGKLVNSFSGSTHPSDWIKKYTISIPYRL